MSTMDQQSISNWSEYNKSLVQRGSIFLWIDEDEIRSWFSGTKNERGRPRVYSDVAISVALRLKLLFGLAWRAVQGFLDSLVHALGLAILVPHHTTFSRRVAQLSLPIETFDIDPEKPITRAVDGSGLKVYGEGEWKTRTHGVQKRRTWRKLHIGIDVETRQIVAGVVTTNDVSDGEVLPELLEQASDLKIGTVAGDGGYDSHAIFDAIEELGATAKIPPHKGAKIKKHGNTAGPKLPRDKAVRGMRALGRKEWKKEIGYHQRSLVENTFGRIKQVLSGKLTSRKFESQVAEAFMMLSIMNRMAGYGLPQYENKN